ncbi:TFIIB-type zinc ribbon-containing protein [Ornithinibacillus sp. FSL M8-0202]|uniref:TFIIB-type zinc ribbon-containing protein n=1 Tax=Ornithinibacillus sp. FSL M8-0202 TaxID=2921616 RepID=UPI0030CFBA30
MIIHYKCPNCGDDMAFDSVSGNLSCASCGRNDSIEEFSDDYIFNTFSEDEAKEYECNNCGAAVITDADTSATSCSFCGAGVVLADRVSGSLAPDMVLPFQISKEQAMEAFKKWCKNGRLTPDGFMTADRIKNITGMYVPFWLYDLHSVAEVRAKATKVRSYTRGDYVYTETKYYDVERKIDLTFQKVPVDASKKMNDELMDKLEPYDFGKLKDFKTAYLAGYLAEKYNYDNKDLLPRVKSKVSSYINKYVSSTINGYSSVKYVDQNINTRERKAYYVLLPVWMVYYDFDKQEHTFAMNGVTGKVVGKPPLSKKKIAAWWGSIAAISFIGMKILSFAIGGELL